MARDFNGTSHRVIATLGTAMNGDWTIGMWLFADDNDNRYAVNINNGTNETQQMAYQNGGGGRFYVGQIYNTTSAFAVSNSALSLGVWCLVFGTFNTADLKCRMYLGLLDTPVAEVPYLAPPVAAVGTRRTGGVNLIVGSQAANTNVWDGRIGYTFGYRRLLSIPEMEQIRLGQRPIQDGNLSWFHPMDSPTATNIEDLSGNAAGSATAGIGLVEDPPNPKMFESVM